MGIDKLTAYIISTREDIIIDAGGPANDKCDNPDHIGKYVGWITLGEADRYRPLLNSEPIYDSGEDAKKAMKDLVEEIKIAVDKETAGKHPIDHVLGDCNEAEIVKEVIKQSKEK